MDVVTRRVLARRWHIVAATVVVVVMAAVLWSPLPRPVRATVSDWGVMAVILVTTVALWVRARLSTNPQRRRAWRLFTLSSLLAAAGNAVLLLPETGLSAPAVVLFTITALLVSSAAAFFFPSVVLSRVELGRILADGLVVCFSLLGILFVVASQVRPDVGLDDRSLFLLVLPAADCVVVTVLVIMVLRSHRADYERFFAAAVGFLCITVADTGFALREMSAGYGITGEPTDLGWFVGYLSIAVAVLARDNPAPAAPTAGVERPLLGTFTVYACLVTAAVVLTAGELDQAALATQLVAVLAVVAVALRELLVTYDDVRLRRQLSTLVDERTEQLRETAEMSAAVAGSVGDGILAADLDGHLTYTNPAAVALLGWSPTELIGRPMTDVLDGTGGEGALRQPEAWIGEAVEHGRVSTGRTRCVGREGTSIPVQMTVSPLTRHAGTAGCVMVFRDLREQDRVERMKSEFVSTVSHELRTPLTSIRGVLGLMANERLGPLAPQAAPLVRIASDSADRLSRLVEDLLDVGRLQSGRFPLSVADHDAAVLARRAVDQGRLLLTERAVELVLDAGDQPLVVHGDQDRIQQVLTNLLSNAAKYAPECTEVAVAVRGDPSGLGGRGAVCFDVTDHGPGIPADKLDEVFDRFVQADQSDTRAKEGTGLGLSIARQLVRAMGGTLGVSSEPWSHTTFTVELPAGGHDAVAAGQDHVTSEGQDATSGGRSATSGGRHATSGGRDAPVTGEPATRVAAEPDATPAGVPAGDEVGSLRG
ncbi:PAS domain S-box-containing protein [Auraticoccus monumenti]|uniref:histidine kinase n=1 Tax=Auraticoccus monumenti TaxID=675864 RepID=A0A1G6V2Z3_9ACTN|nr:PAS domain S-box-containing protein [Auraticoccus monumenti]